MKGEERRRGRETASIGKSRIAGRRQRQRHQLAWPSPSSAWPGLAWSMSANIVTNYMRHKSQEKNSRKSQGKVKEKPSKSQGKDKAEKEREKERERDLAGRIRNCGRKNQKQLQTATAKAIAIAKQQLQQQQCLTVIGSRVSQVSEVSAVQADLLAIYSPQLDNSIKRRQLDSSNSCCCCCSRCCCC